MVWVRAIALVMANAFVLDKFPVNETIVVFLPRQAPAMGHILIFYITRGHTGVGDDFHIPTICKIESGHKLRATSNAILQPKL